MVASRGRESGITRASRDGRVSHPDRCTNRSPRSPGSNLIRPSVVGGNNVPPPREIPRRPVGERLCGQSAVALADGRTPSGPRTTHATQTAATGGRTAPPSRARPDHRRSARPDQSRADQDCSHCRGHAERLRLRGREFSAGRHRYFNDPSGRGADGTRSRRHTGPGNQGHLPENGILAGPVGCWSARLTKFCEASPVARYGTIYSGVERTHEPPLDSRHVEYRHHRRIDASA